MKAACHRFSRVSIAALFIGLGLAARDRASAQTVAPLPAAGKKIVELSPFAVQVSKNDARYHAENTLAANPDGTPSVFRITDGQVASFTTTFNY